MSRQLPNSGRPIAPLKFAHFVLRTRKMEELKNWYMTVLGAHVAFENPMIAFLTYDDEHHRIALVNNPNWAERAEGSVGTDHVAYTFASLGDLLATYRRLKAAGIEPAWCVNHGPTTSMYYRDPEGNRVEFQVDNFDSVELLNGWFRSGAFAKNPIGTNFDPERLIARFENGDSIAELMQQGSA